MTVEPEAAYTVLRRPLMPQGVRTLAEYQANVAARFGNGKLPSWAQLAKRESHRAMKTADAASPAPMSDAAKAAIIMAKREKGLSTLQIVVDVITAPMTRGDITQAVGMAESTVDLHLRTALDWGLVTRTKCKNVYIWEQRAVAAE